jgi:hypothetical protein
MKKIIAVLVSGAIFSLATTTKIAAQTEKGLAFSKVKNSAALAAYAKEFSGDEKTTASSKEEVKSAEKDLKASKANLKAMKANLRAAESFKKMFKDAPDARWDANENTIVADFSKNAVNTKVVYNKNGRWIHTLTYFTPDDTPADIRSLIDQDYPYADISQAVKVNEGDMEFYIVQLEDKKTYKQVSVYNGQTGLIKEFLKSK